MKVKITNKKDKTDAEKLANAIAAIEKFADTKSSNVVFPLPLGATIEVIFFCSKVSE